MFAWQVEDEMRVGTSGERGPVNIRLIEYVTVALRAPCCHSVLFA